MTKLVQSRSVATRRRLIDVADAIAREAGLAALRADAVVAAAGVAKGTFFSHFPDKDHLIAVLVAERLTYRPGARDVDALVAALMPVFDVMAAEPEVIAVLARFSGAEGSGAALDLAICDILTDLAGDLGQMQALGAVRSEPDALTLAEGLFSFLMYAAGRAQCSLMSEEHAARQNDARALLIRLIGNWLSP